MSNLYKLNRYICQIMMGAPLDISELSALLKHTDEIKSQAIGNAMLRLYHTTDSGFDPIAVAGELERRESLDLVGGLPGLMVMIDDNSEKCPHCGQSMSHITSITEH